MLFSIKRLCSDDLEPVSLCTHLVDDDSDVYIKYNNNLRSVRTTMWEVIMSSQRLRFLKCYLVLVVPRI